MERKLMVAGMHCNGCRALVTDALEELGAKNVSVKLNEKGLSEVSFVSDAPMEKLVKAIEKEGYRVK
jgi:copper chaperone CopZ